MLKSFFFLLEIPIRTLDLLFTYSQQTGLIIFFCLSLNYTVFTAYYWLFAQESCLLMFGGTYVVPEIEDRSLHVKQVLYLLYYLSNHAELIDSELIYSGN